MKNSFPDGGRGLNIISSLAMTKMGRVKNGLMSDMVPTNQKLRKRKKFISSKI